MTCTLLIPDDMRQRCFAAADLRRLSQAMPAVWPQEHESADLAGFWARHAGQTEILVTGWGTTPLSAPMIAGARRLRAIVHAAGSVKTLLPAVAWERGLAVASCNRALAIGVAETTLGMLIAGFKGFFPSHALTRRGGWKINHTDMPGFVVRELYDVTVGVIGASQVGRHLMQLLRQFDVHMILTDPCVSPDEARELGAELVELGELISRSDAVCLAAPALPSTRHMLGREQFRLMRDGAIFINTARGMIVDEQALAEELKTGRIWAFLDVTDPEPPAADHPFRTLPNVVLTPHIAGCVGNGCRRLGRSAVDQVLEFASGKRMSGTIERERLEMMA